MVKRQVKSKQEQSKCAARVVAGVLILAVGLFFLIGAIVDSLNGNLFASIDDGSHTALNVYSVVSSTARVLLAIFGVLAGILLFFRKNAVVLTKTSLVISVVSLVAFLNIYNYNNIAVSETWNPLVDIVRNSTGVEENSVMFENDADIETVTYYNDCLGKAALEIAGLSSIVTLIATLVCVAIIRYNPNR